MSPVPDHSVFKQAFLNLLEGREREPIPDGYITGEELGLFLKNKVPEYNPAQHPQYGKIRDPSLDQGDFVFVLRNVTNSASIQQKLFRIEEEGKVGFIDSDGTIVIPPEFDYGREWGEGILLVGIGPKESRKYGLLSTTGKVLIEPNHQDGYFESQFREGLGLIKKHGRYGYIDLEGNIKIQPTLDYSYGFSDGLAAFKSGGKWVVTKERYYTAAGHTGGLTGYIDRTGKVTIPPKFERSDGFSEGLAATQEGAKWGYIDKTGAFAIEPRFDHAWSFSEGRAVVSLNGKYGFIDKIGDWVTEPKFDQADWFSEGNGLSSVSR